MTGMTGDGLAEMLADGWKVVGYSVCMMAAGALAHNVLIQKDDKLKSITIGTNNGQELARSVFDFAPNSPQPMKKKGFFG